MSKTIVITSLIACWIFFTWLTQGNLHRSDLLHIVFCDVGQGDATLLSTGRTQVLIDGGIDQSVLACLRQTMPAFDYTVEFVIATHADADHIAGLVGVFEKYRVNWVITNGLRKESADFEAFEQSLENELAAGARHWVGGEGRELDMGQLQLKFLAPDSYETLAFVQPEQTLWDTKKLKTEEIDDHNARSIALIASFGEIHALFTGDLEEQQELALIERNLITPVTLLKAGHHGSKTSTSSLMLERARPEIVSISAGKNNRYGHPAPEVIDRINQAGIAVVRTDMEGTLHFITNGRDVWRHK